MKIDRMVNFAKASTVDLAQRKVPLLPEIGEGT
jgi:hypothetical protein